MLKQWIVKFWTTEGTIAGIQVNALSPIEAQNVAKGLPNFKELANYPEEVRM